MGRLVDDKNKAIYCDALEDEHEYVGKKLDLVEVVRCNDCKTQQTCNFAQYQGNNGFCSLAERKDEVEDE